jgi:hypothetical protein
LGTLFSNPTHNNYNVIKTAGPLFPMTGAEDIVQAEPTHVKAIKKKTWLFGAMFMPPYK